MNNRYAYNNYSSIQRIVGELRDKLVEELSTVQDHKLNAKDDRYDIIVQYLMDRVESEEEDLKVIQTIINDYKERVQKDDADSLCMSIDRLRVNGKIYTLDKEDGLFRYTSTKGKVTYTDEISFKYAIDLLNDGVASIASQDSDESSKPNVGLDITEVESSRSGKIFVKEGDWFYHNEEFSKGSIKRLGYPTSVINQFLEIGTMKPRKHQNIN